MEFCRRQRTGQRERCANRTRGCARSCGDRHAGNCQQRPESRRLRELRRHRCQGLRCHNRQGDGACTAELALGVWSAAALLRKFRRCEKLFAAGEHLRLEGVVSKRAASRYRSGKSTDWIKVKCPTWRIANHHLGGYCRAILTDKASLQSRSVCLATTASVRRRPLFGVPKTRQISLSI